MSNQQYLEIPTMACYLFTYNTFQCGDEDVEIALSSKMSYLSNDNFDEFLEYDQKYILTYNYCANSGNGAWELCLTNAEKKWREDEILLRFENLRSFLELVERGELEDCKDFSRFEHMRMTNIEYKMPSFLIHNPVEEIAPEEYENDGYCKQCNLELHVCPIFGCGDEHSFDEYLNRQGYVDTSCKEDEKTKI